jgi:hypothetical protein
VRASSPLSCLEPDHVLGPGEGSCIGEEVSACAVRALPRELCVGRWVARDEAEQLVQVREARGPVRAALFWIGVLSVIEIQVIGAADDDLVTALGERREGVVVVAERRVGVDADPVARKVGGVLNARRRAAVAEGGGEEPVGPDA